MLFYHEDLQNHSITLSKEESAHCIKVLRKSKGDVIHFTDGNGTMAKGVIEQADVKKCVVNIESVEKKAADKFHIHIAVAPTKNIDRMAWFVEKSVEIGIHEITFISCKHSERRKMNIDKMQAKAISAIKQSLSPFLPKINPLIDYHDFIENNNNADQKFIAHLENVYVPDLFLKSSADKNYCVIIGPEGDFTDDELSRAKTMQFESVKLGPKRLRTETAALVACHTLNLVNIQ